MKPRHRWAHLPIMMEYKCKIGFIETKPVSGEVSKRMIFLGSQARRDLDLAVVWTGTHHQKELLVRELPVTGNSHQRTSEQRCENKNALLKKTTLIERLPPRSSACPQSALQWDALDLPRRFLPPCSWPEVDRWGLQSYWSVSCHHYNVVGSNLMST